jgi:hypothetical protein
MPPGANIAAVSLGISPKIRAKYFDTYIIEYSIQFGGSEPVPAPRGI